MVNKNIKQKKIFLKEESIKKKISEAALNLLKSRSWSKIKMKDIFEKAGIKSNSAFFHVKNKKDILVLIQNYFDNQMYENIQDNATSNKHDKIFDILMTRFELYNKHRTAVIKLFNYIINKPDLLIIFIPITFKFLTNVLELSDISSDGIYGNLKAEGLLIIYLMIFLVWKKDDTSGLEKTMTAVDNYLSRGESFINLFTKK